MRTLKLVLCHHRRLVIILVVLTERNFPLSLFISQLLAKAIPVREPFSRFHASLRIPGYIFIQPVSVKNRPDVFLVFPLHREKWWSNLGLSGSIAAMTRLWPTLTTRKSAT
ncbi:hypothetical protein FJU30_09485 [Affinibrenneria salicis]|uniref:Uncharacterized protein n=1 Tax=Affinibrenneria salicis TaxID=2590031 RepID=A0A5J5G1D6_9GAMM|nr:hypothetical protein FJU30_09485 [Affinibrenneria salicis]